jgi:N-acetyl-gamma-glutamyl-phosphate reductase
LIHSGLLLQNEKLCCFSLTGYTGGGKAMIAAYESPARQRGDDFSAPKQYALAQQHKHLPEMRRYAGLEFAPAFCPVVADFDCGMEVTIPLNLPGFGPEAARECYHAYYANAALTRVLEPGAPALPLNAYKGIDRMDIAVEGNDERVLLIARFDNLGKGASGAAVQCMNIALGLDETTGISI